MYVDIEKRKREAERNRRDERARNLRSLLTYTYTSLAPDNPKLFPAFSFHPAALNKQARPMHGTTSNTHRGVTSSLHLSHECISAKSLSKLGFFHSFLSLGLGIKPN